MLLVTLGASWLVNLSADKNKIRVGQYFECHLFLSLILKFKSILRSILQNIIGAYSRNNLRKAKDGAYVINFDKFKSIRTHS